ncbi:MAG: helix-turn-helix domain-containing protein [Syntrophobacteraceae bacterium]
MEKSIYTNQQEKLQNLLRRVREEAGLRQVDLADLVGEPQPFVSRYERGERRLDVLELRKICKAIGITLSEFIALLEEELGPE